jgi:hypothetical protein
MPKLPRFNADDVVAMRPCWLMTAGGEKRLRSWGERLGGIFSAADVMSAERIPFDDRRWVVNREEWLPDWTKPITARAALCEAMKHLSERGKLPPAPDQGWVDLATKILDGLPVRIPSPTDHFLLVPYGFRRLIEISSGLPSSTLEGIYYLTPILEMGPRGLRRSKAENRALQVAVAALRAAEAEEPTPPSEGEEERKQ